MENKIEVKENKLYQLIKRTFDIVFSSFAIIILFIPITIICLIKAIEDYRTPYWKMIIKKADEKSKKKFIYINKAGESYEIIVIPDIEKNKKNKHKWISPLYVSDRIGLNGKKFKFYKIRTMVHHAEGMKQQLIDLGFNEAEDPMFKMALDPRITFFGRFLRSTSIDELPQFLNVFIGDLSIVGPRSPLPLEFENFDEYSKQKVLVKGGLLCYWQIQHKRNSIPFKEWIDLDLKYIQERSILVDLKIIFVGIFMVLFDKTGE